MRHVGLGPEQRSPVVVDVAVGGVRGVDLKEGNHVIHIIAFVWTVEERIFPQ